MAGTKAQLAPNMSRARPHCQTTEPNEKHLTEARRTVEQASTRLQKYDALFTEAAAQYGVPKALLMAVCLKESSAHALQQRPPLGQPVEEGQQRSYGLMQLDLPTARGVGAGVTSEANIMNPRLNIMSGAKKLSQLYEQFGQNWDLALSAYNAGPGKLKKHVASGCTESWGPTRGYVTKIKAFMAVLEEPAANERRLASNVGWSAYRTG